MEGCLEWQEHGLGEPDSVTEATEQYRTEMDTLAAFLEDRCVVQKDLVTPATPLYKEYRFWCEDAGEKPETQKMFGMRLRERGFANKQLTSGQHKGCKGWVGIGLKVDHPGPEGPRPPDKTPPEMPRAGDDGLPGRPSGDDGLPEESAVDKPNAPGATNSSRPSRPKNQNLQGEIPREAKVLEKRSTSSTPSTRRLTEEEAREAQELISQGMSPKFAREAVLKRRGEEEGNPRA